MENLDSKQLLTVRETARLLDVHENTVRNWVAKGDLKSARLPGARFHRFEREEVERLARSRGQVVVPIRRERERVPRLPDPEEIVASMTGARRAVGPELADATQLALWAERREAQGLFPALIRRLLVACPEVTDLKIRAREGVGAPGWDGLVSATPGSLWVPAGRSGWELSTEKRIRQKAQRDYDERTKEALELDPTKATFVFATPRRWMGADAWERERRADGIWRDVQVIDADRLEAWLEAMPAVHYWLSEQLDLRPRDAITLETWWERFASRTDPRLPEKLLTAGRTREQTGLDEFLDSAPATTGLKAGSREEAVAFVAAHFALSNKPIDRPVVVVTTAEVWDRLAVSSAPMVLVPLFGDPAVAAAVERGHHVVVPLGREDVPRGQVIELPRIHRMIAHEVLRESGVDFERADQLAGLARRSLVSYMRWLSRDPRMSRPTWGSGDDASLFAALMLVGGWSSRDGDRKIVAEVTETAFSAVEASVHRWALTEDPPFTQAGSGGWHLTSPEEAFDVLHPLLTAPMLERWRTAVLRVLGETDPGVDLTQEEKLTAGLRGSDATYSSELRRGLASSLALLGAFGESSAQGGPATLADHAVRTVRDLFEEANAEDAGLLWRSLSGELPLLAEAAPQSFLDGIDQGLSGKAPLLASMFRDTADQSFLSVSSPHTGLLWALETLCWSSEFFAEALMALARLASIDPGGRLGNRPIASLRAVLLPWIPYTSASVEQRIDALRKIRAKFPQLAWQLLLDLLPKFHDHSSPTTSPRFRDWKLDREGVTISEWAATIEGLTDQVSEALAEDPLRWLQVIGSLGSLPEPHRSRLISELEAVVRSSALDAEQKLELWRNLSKEATHHRDFPEAQWAMSEEPLSRLEAIVASLEPKDVVVTSAELFDWRPRMPGIDPFDHNAHDAAVTEARNRAIDAVMNEEGFVGICRLAEESPQPQFVGGSVADVLGDQVADEFIDLLDADDVKQREMASAWVRVMANSQDANWIGATAEKVWKSRRDVHAAFLRQLPSGPELFELLGRLDPDTQDLYWATAHPLTFDGDLIAWAVGQFLEHKRPVAAIDLLSVRLSRGKDAPQGVTADVVADALRDALSAEPEAPSLSTFNYEIAELLDRLGDLGADEQVVAQLEWAYFPLLEYSSHQPRALFAALKRDPAFFVDLVSLVYRGKNERPRELDEAAVNLARNAWSVLHAWNHDIPGQRDDGTIDRVELQQWTRQARLLLEERDRADIGDQQIGQMFSASPAGEDGVWPAEPIRDLVEDIGSRDLETGLHIGRANSRGPTSRGALDGGDQEWELARRYREWASVTGTRWPRTTRLLRGLGESYEHEARRWDVEADVRANRD